MIKLTLSFILNYCNSTMSELNLKKILVPLDGSKNSFRGLEHAISLAKLSGASIIGAHVSYVPGNLANPKQGFINQELVTEAKHHLNAAKKLCDDSNISFVSKILPGTPGNGIIKFVQDMKNGVNMIVMGSRGLTSAKEAFLGSVSNHVTHKSKVPVLVVK